jgi:hypothetical protein
MNAERGRIQKGGARLGEADGKNKRFWQGSMENGAYDYNYMLIAQTTDIKQPNSCLL